VSSTDDSDLDNLLLRLARGDRSAFKQAFAILWPPALRLCQCMLRNDADAADAAQQALEKILVRSATTMAPDRHCRGRLRSRAGVSNDDRGRARRKETFDDFAAAASGVDAEHELASGSF